VSSRRPSPRSDGSTFSSARRRRSLSSAGSGNRRGMAARLRAQSLDDDQHCRGRAAAAPRVGRGDRLRLVRFAARPSFPGAPITYSAAKAALHAYVRGNREGRSPRRGSASTPSPPVTSCTMDRYGRRGSQPMPARCATRWRATWRWPGWCTPEEVANLVTYLASPRAAFATGGVWTLDGGQVRS